MKNLKIFTFHQERYVQVRLIIPFIIEAESQEEAIEKAKLYVESDVEEEKGITLDEYDSEDLMLDMYDRYETLDPRADGEPTSGIFYDDENGDHCIACNGDGSWVDF